LPQPIRPAFLDNLAGVERPAVAFRRRIGVWLSQRTTSRH
jgi:hypothetical protein